MNRFFLTTISLVLPLAVSAQTEVPNTFQAGQPARAAEVNANFDTLETAIDANATAITQIPAGPEGPIGPQGPEGPQGPIGDPAEPGSIGLTQINTAEVQARVGSNCGLGSFISAIAADGSVSCSDGGSRDSIFTTRYGQEALFSNTSGYGNVASGYQTMYLNTIGEGNTAYGTQALRDNTVGNYNTASGYQALIFTTGSSNTAVGHMALKGNTTGNANTATGKSALFLNASGLNNTATGYEALYSNLADFNTAMGWQALYSNISGDSNTAVGHATLWSNTTGSHNIAIGRSALESLTEGSYNIAIGFGAGFFKTTGSRNISIGSDEGGDESYTTRIGENSQERAFIAGIRDRTPDLAQTAVNVVIDAAGQLGTVSSSRRYKEDIQDMGNASERLLQLRPVTFRYKDTYADSDKPTDFGLIAEEVAEVFPELVVYDDDNQAETVKYRLLSSLLLNELQKQNARLAIQEKKLAELSSHMAELQQQAGQIAQVDK